MGEIATTVNVTAAPAAEDNRVAIETATSNHRGEKCKKANHALRKRNPICFPKRKKDIYVTNRSNFKAQLNRCEKRLDSDETELIIHGLGCAIKRACRLALLLEKNHRGTLLLDVRTSTVDLIDDLQPLDDNGDYEMNDRQNSSIHIRVYRRASVGTLRYAKC